MKSLKLFIVSAVALTAAACTSVEVAETKSAEEQADAVVQQDQSTIAGKAIVELTEEFAAVVEKDLERGAFLQTKSAEMNNAFSSIGVKSVKRLYEDGGKWEARHRAAGLHRWYVIEYNENMPRTKASASLEEIPGVVYVEPYRKIKPMAIFNDPMFDKQWHYYNDGTRGSNYKKGADINVLPVWENYTAGSKTVIVSVVDGGIDMEHEDLAAVSLPGGKDGSKNFVSGAYKIVAHDHGTHVAGTIGAINNNGKGVCGIAGGSDGKGGVRLMSCQVFQTGKDGKDQSGDFYNAMVWGADHGAVISQNSWGHVYNTADEASRGSVGGIKSAIDYFINYAGCDENGKQLPDSPMKGGIVFFSAGNDSWPDGWPAEYSAVQPLCVSVGAVAPNGTRSYYSNYGDWVTIAAPGGDYTVGDEVWSTLPGNGYGKMQGTSMACPHVSGVAALVISQCGGPGFTNEMLREKLVGGANANFLPRNAKIGPLLDAYGAVTYGGTIAPDPVDNYSVSARANNLDFVWNVTKDKDDKKAFGYILLAGKDRKAIEEIDIRAGIPAGVKSSIVEVGSKALGDEISGSVTDLEFDTDYYVGIVGYDYNKNYSAVSEVKKTKTAKNNPPVVETDYQGDYRVKSHEVLEVLYRIYDPDGHAIEVEFEKGSDSAVEDVVPDGRHRVTFIGSIADPGKYTARYTVTDSYGMSTVYPIIYEILENHPPVVKKNINNMIFEQTASKVTIDMDEYLEDPDGEQLVYEVTMSSKGIVHLNQVENKLNLTTLDYGMVEITITAYDAKRKSVKLPFKVLVRDPEAEADAYPNPVKDFLNISDGSSKNVSVEITNSAGAVVFSASETCDAFSPIRVDMSSYAPGRYGVKITSNGKSVSKTIVKL